MGKLYYEYEVVCTVTNKVLETIFIPEATDTKGWVIGTWYMSPDTNKPIEQIRNKDNSKLATYIGHHYDLEGGDLF